MYRLKSSLRYLSRFVLTLLLFVFCFSFAVSAPHTKHKHRTAKSRRVRHHSPTSSRSRRIKVRATFYSPSSRSKTATGRSARLPGLAVDPRVIPLGSRVSIPGFGVRIADDTGGSIKGKRIDIRLPSGRNAHARKHGVKYLQVQVTPPAKRTRKHKTRNH